MRWSFPHVIFVWTSICHLNYVGTRLDLTESPGWFLQWRMDWIYHPLGRSILSFMFQTWKGSTSQKSLKGRSDHLLPLWSMVRRSMKWRRFSGIRAKVPGACIWWCGKVIPSLRLVGSLNRISKMLLWSWRITCATSELRISDDVGTEEARRRVDGGPGEHKATGALQLKDQCLMGIYTWGEIAFGVHEPTWMVL